MRQVINRREAEKFYREELGWPTATFDCVNWDGMEQALEKQGDLLRLWISKQVNGFCGPQSMVAHWDKKRDGKYLDWRMQER